MFPTHCLATHINMDTGSRPAWTLHPILAAQHTLTPYSRRERDGFARTAWFVTEGSGYRAEQETKPQTLGYALADSRGLAGVDLRETARLDRRIPLDARRSVHLGLDLLVQHGGPRGERADLLRSGA